MFTSVARPTVGIKRFDFRFFPLQIRCWYICKLCWLIAQEHWRRLSPSKSVQRRSRPHPPCPPSHSEQLGVSFYYVTLSLIEWAGDIIPFILVCSLSFCFSTFYPHSLQATGGKFLSYHRLVRLPNPPPLTHSPSLAFNPRSSWAI